MVGKPKVYFRADGSNKIGLGHVIRSLALAEMLKDDFECHFIIRNPISSLVNLIDQFVVSIIVLPAFDSYEMEAKYLLEKCLPEKAIVVLDGYHFDTTYQSIIKIAGNGLVCIDDIHAYHFVSDCVINHAPGISRNQYSLDPQTELLHGTGYSLLRSPFINVAAEENEIIGIEEVFLCFGGGDKDNLTEKILDLLLDANLSLKRINVILGKAYLFKERIMQFTQNSQHVEVSIFSDLSAVEMVKILKRSHLAIVPASSILYEAIAVKMPIISGYYVENQKNVFKGFMDLGVIEGVGDFHNISELNSIFKKFNAPYIKQMMNLQSVLKIQDSTTNLVGVFKRLNEKMKSHLFIRNAQKEDLHMYFEWVNDGLVRVNSINETLITIKDHSRWFLSRLKAEETFMYVLMNGDDPIGQIRFDILEGSAKIDYSISTSFRGKGYGKEIVSRGIEILLSQVDYIDEITAEVKPSNIASCKVFNRLDFEILESDVEITNLVRFKLPITHNTLKNVG